MNIRINTNKLSFDSRRGVLVGELSELALRGFPKEMLVVSHHTGRTVRFVVDCAAAERHEHWDGEECHYLPMERGIKVKRLVLIND